MNYEAAITLAEQRMREIGKSPGDYHFSPIVITGTQEELNKGEIEIKGYNEYFYLINYEKYSGFEIISDTGYFNADDYTNNTVQEFTGMIHIKLAGITQQQSASSNIIKKMMAISEKSDTAILQVKPIEFLRVTVH